jgi:anti-sigma factor ChrR (cupin superfamily)
VSEPFHLPGLLGGGWRDAAFAPFREGVEISRLHEGPPAVALLRYTPGAGVPAHYHRGLETILVLEGAQSDDRGTYPEGSLILNPEGTSHRVWSDEGCVVLIQWTLPVEFLGDGATDT